MSRHVNERREKALLAKAIDDVNRHAKARRASASQYVLGDDEMLYPPKIAEAFFKFSISLPMELADADDDLVAAFNFITPKQHEENKREPRK